MFPMEVKDWASYLKLIVGLVPWDGIQPWMRGVRLVFRSTQEAGRFEPRLSNAPRVRRTKFELTQDQIEGAIADQINDEQAPVEQRMQALMSMAVLDYAYNRPEDAIAKYNHLLGYYQSTGNKALEAFVLNGLGDVAHRQGNLEHALERYECAAIPAAEAKEGMILASIIRNLGDVAFEQKRYGEAEQYFDQLDKLTAATLDAECKARLWNGEGSARRSRRRTITQSKAGRRRPIFAARSGYLWHWRPISLTWRGFSNGNTSVKNSWSWRKRSNH